MKLTIEIPKEYEDDFNRDKFEDFFNRVYCDISYNIYTHNTNMCGNYEKETAEMFMHAFENAIKGEEE